jgi:hypothetical protein
MSIKTNLQTFLSLFILVFIVSCSQSIEEKLKGEWRAVDVKVDSEDENLSREKLDALRRMEKSVVFVFNEDQTMSAFTGGSEINGVWEYDEGTSQVSILFENTGSTPTPFGKLKDGRIIKDHETGGVSVQTIYEKKD